MSTSVLEQFTKWPYPDMHSFPGGAFSAGHKDYDLPLDHLILWPERPYNAEMDILVAGCGTCEAAVVAYDNPHSRVVGIDISETSLQRCLKLKTQFNLENLTVHCLDLHQAQELHVQFDLVLCCGVLHHLPDPQIGLRRLGEVLRPEGVLLLSLYGRYARTGVYMLQDALRRLEVHQTASDVTFTRRVLETLPQNHPLFSNTPVATILQGSDTDIVDTFLNRHDRAYSVPELLHLIDGSGLHFQCWFDNLDYFAEGKIPTDGELAERIATLPMPEQWAVVELLSQSSGRHRAVLRKSGHAVIDIGNRFQCGDSRNLKPALRRGTRIFRKRRSNADLRREWHTLPLNAFETRLLETVDGTATIDAIASGLGLDNRARGDAAAFFFRMWRLGHCIFAQ